tara:strand:+ start:3561 stop:4925 length:1365 start_codon:yes stop_codon:yes gene_type:complete
MKKQKSNLRSLPSVDLLISCLDASVQITATHSLLVQISRDVLSTVRSQVLEGGTVPSIDDLLFKVEEKLALLRDSSPRRLINGSGVLIQTNIGRSPLSERAKIAMWESSSYSELEYDLERGSRGSRLNQTRELLTTLTGAEDCLVVNNNASALLTLLSVFAVGKEVLVSRGEAVEIGGGVRIPDILAQSNAQIIEVGTTNRTYVEDYAKAINPENTAAILRIHQSNFKIVGFTSKPNLKDLAKLAQNENILLLDDLGSGCLLETEEFGLPHEPTVKESLDAGVDLAFFSGDKLIGGPQSGIIVGKKDLIKVVREHPLARALRLDKTATAALNATLLSYVEQKAEEEIPIWQMISSTPEQLKMKASRWASIIGAQATVVNSQTMIGGGALPDIGLPTWCVAIKHDDGAEKLASLFRSLPVPIVTRIEDDLVLVDPRTIDVQDDEILCNAFVEILK